MKHSDVFKGIMGVAVADAFGYPYQFRKRDTFDVKPEMVPTGEGKARLLPAGCWSDDTSLTVATMEAISENGGINLDEIMLNFCMWLKAGSFTPFGFSFDVGTGTYVSINNYIRDGDVFTSGLRDFKNNGNGSLMRILPLAYTDCSLEDVALVSSLTHAHDYSVHACQIQVEIARRLLNGFGIAQALRDVMNSEPFNTFSEYADLVNVGTWTRDEVKSSGFVLDTMYAAMWCLLKTNNYRDCIMTASKLGLDTDTIGAVAGGLAGIMYGVGGAKGIPQSWIRSLKGRKTLVAAITNFERFLAKT